MKTAIKLVLIYFALQIAGLILAILPCFIYLLVIGGNIADAQTMALAPSLLIAMLLMLLYLWNGGYISKEKVTWSPVSPLYMVLTVVITLAGIWLLDLLTSVLHLPDLMEQTFDLMQAGWLGILCIAVIGPILEELLFRGAITKLLLQRKSPATAIVISALIFGLFHINPVQVVGATIIGLLLAWIYYKTASLLPCILIHIINNSLSIYLNRTYPEVKTLGDLMDEQLYLTFTLIAAVLFIASYLWMKRTTVPYLWNKEEEVDLISK